MGRSGTIAVQRRLSRIIGIVGFILLAALLLPGGVLAQPPGQPDLARERAALARATAQARSARERGEQFEARATRAVAEADRARDQAAALAARIQQSEADLRAGQARLAIIAAQQRALARRLAMRRQPIARLTAALQQLARRSPVTALIEPGPVGDAVHRRIVLAQMLPVITTKTRELRAEVARAAALRRSAASAADALRRTRATLVDQQDRLAVAEQRLRIAARALRESAQAETERALAMGEQARDLGDLLGRIEAAGSVREALVALPGPTLRPDAPAEAALPQASPPPDKAPARPPAWRIPVVGDVVAGFGETATSGAPSRGLTIATAPGASVVAPADGHVVFAGPFRGYGQILIVEHGQGWTSLVARLDRLTARVGDALRAGDPVGRAGPGRPRILVELRHGQEPVDIAALVR